MFCTPSETYLSRTLWQTWFLGGGFIHIFFNIHPEPWGFLMQFWSAYFSDGLVQPPTSDKLFILILNPSSPSRWAGEVIINVRFLRSKVIMSKRSRSSKAYLERTYQLNFLFHMCNDTFVVVSCVLVYSGGGHQAISVRFSSIILTLHECLFARVYFFCKGPNVLREYIICQFFFIFGYTHLFVKYVMSSTT